VRHVSASIHVNASGGWSGDDGGHDESGAPGWAAKSAWCTSGSAKHRAPRGVRPWDPQRPAPVKEA
jgi:hypothetical protein